MFSVSRSNATLPAGAANCGRRVRGHGVAASGISLVVGLCGLALVAGPQSNASVTDAGRQEPLASSGASLPKLESELSTETSTTYRQPDGSFQVRSSLDAVNYLDETGEWQQIDNTLVDAPGATYAAENAENDFTAQLPADASAAPVKVTSEAGVITMRMHGIDSAPVVEGASATYTDVEDASSVIYETVGSGVKENIVLDQAPADAPQLSYTYTIKLSAGLTPALAADGSVRVRETDGTTAFVIPAGNMSDSAAPEAGFSHDVDYDLHAVGTGWELTVTPDMGWLTDPSRVYPVKIDPSVLTKSIQRNCWLDQANPSSNGCGVNASYLRVGGGSGTLRRSILDFDTTAIPAAATIDSADLRLYLYSAQGTSNATVNYGLHRPGKSWNNGATWSSTGVGSDTWSGGGSPLGAQVSGTSLGIYAPTSGWRTFDAKSFVTNWKNGTWPRDGIAIRQENETTPSTSIAFAAGNHPTTTNRPELVVTYRVDQTPGLSELAVSPGESGYFTGGENQISVNVTDPDSPEVRVTFAANDTSGVEVWTGESVVDLGTLASTSATKSIPIGSLEVGQTYEFTAIARDATSASAPQRYTAQSDAGAPVITTGCFSPCRTIPPVDVYSGDVPNDGSPVRASIPNTALPFDRNEAGWLHFEATASNTSGQGVYIFSADVPRPIAPTLSPTNNSRNFRTWLGDNDQIHIVNMTGAPRNVSLKLTGWEPLDPGSQESTWNSGQDSGDDPVEGTEYPEKTDPSQAQEISLLERLPDSPSAADIVAGDPEGQSEECEDDVDDEGNAIESCTMQMTEDQYNYRLENPTQEERDAAANAPTGDKSADAFRPTNEQSAYTAKACSRYPLSYTPDRRSTCSKVSFYYSHYRTINRVKTLVGRAKFQVRLVTTLCSRLLKFSDFNCNTTDALYTLQAAWGSASRIPVRSYFYAIGNSGKCGDSRDGANFDYLDLRNQTAFHRTIMEPSPSRNDVIYCTTAFKVQVRTKRSRFYFTATYRCDRVAYLRKGRGCVFSQWKPTYQISLSGPYDEVAEHIYLAQKDLKRHWGAKNRGGAPLTRKYAGVKYNPNRSAAQRKCARLGVVRSCDEYSFASTAQGCAAYTCHVAGVDLNQNISQGRDDLSPWYSTERILNGDDYWVKVTS